MPEDIWERYHPKFGLFSATEYRLNADGWLECLTRRGTWHFLTINHLAEWEIYPPKNWRCPIEPWMRVVNPELLDERNRAAELQHMDDAIERWIRIASGVKGIDDTRCNLYNHYECHGTGSCLCPISRVLGKPKCLNTAYYRVIQSAPGTPQYYRACREMLGQLYQVRKAIENGA